MTSISSIPSSQQPGATIDEHFKVFSASLGDRSASQSNLERRSRPIFGVRKPDIATAISRSGWLATATITDISIFHFEGVSLTRDLKRVDFIECGSKSDEIKDIALSDDLLAVITRSRLIVYGYDRESGGIDRTVVYDQTIDQRLHQAPTWISQSLAICQRGLVKPGLLALAWIAVGGQKKNGVKLFRFMYNAGWTHNRRLILNCEDNSGSVRLVGFSPNRFGSATQFMVFGVNTSNQIYCWDLRHEIPRGVQELGSFWQLDCRWGTSHTLSLGKIVSASLFISPGPSKQPYFFCAINRNTGSQILCSFIAPIERRRQPGGMTAARHQPLPETSITSDVLCGTVTDNGLFMVAVEENVMRFSTLRGATNGGITCMSMPLPLEWRSRLEPATNNVSGISISVKEPQGREPPGQIIVSAVDCRGHFLSMRVSVSEMPATASPLIRQPRRSELSTDVDAAIRELMGEPLSGQSSRVSRSTMEGGSHATHNRGSGSTINTEEDADLIKIDPS